jgi:hypothetical protein
VDLLLRRVAWLLISLLVDGLYVGLWANEAGAEFTENWYFIWLVAWTSLKKLTIGPLALLKAVLLTLGFHHV